MKRKTTILALVLAFVMSFGSLSVFAAVGPPTADTEKAVKGVQSMDTLKDELSAERFAMDLAEQTEQGGYKLVDTATVKTMTDAVIVDTMPAGSWSAHRVPGAVNVECGDNGPNGEFTDEQKAALLKAVRKYSGYKPETTYYWNTKIKKWSTKKPSSKNWGKCTRKGDKYYGKKTKTIKPYIKDKTIVIYCGFVKCKRSHAAAAYLVENGYTKVYRYPGGIEAWGDAELAFEGTDAE